MGELVYLDAGRRPYGWTLALQRRLVQRVRAAEAERAYLILVEHDPPVITLGRGRGSENIRATPQGLAELGIEVHRTSRGGDVTYHGPGQLVGYPIVRVDLHGRDVHRFLRDLEEVLIRTARRLGAAAGRESGLTGVWTDRGKIAAIGIAVSRWVSYHGFALNVCPDLSHFRTIVPCGLADRDVTSLSEVLGRAVGIAEAKRGVVACMMEVFAFDGVRPGAIEDDGDEED